MPEQAKTVALVTGASSGLGAEFCRQLAPRCDVIIAVARRQARLRALADELAGQAELQPVVADLTSVEGISRVVEALRQKGPADILVNNAGFSTFGQFADLGIDSQRDMLSLHADATITLCRAAVPFMRERGGGQIINVSSLGAFMPGKGLAVYGATKAFLNYFSQALQLELAGTGVEVQALCPGYIRTEFHDEIAAQGFDAGRIPPEMWLQASAVVAASLEALGSGRVLVVPGESFQGLVRMGLQGQLAALQ
jgi:short-subunit dehydrogenase